MKVALLAIRGAAGRCFRGLELGRFRVLLAWGGGREPHLHLGPLTVDLIHLRRVPA